MTAQSDIERQPMANFRKTWKRSGLSLPQVAELLGVSIYTVQSWARPTTSKAARQCPREYIALLERAK